ncbi:MAG: methyltransferase domain-containing protein [Coriobacteriia bacterium]|nr:methyltransferase domain-containing protein [Coriobacteriia bacterium]
MLADAVACLVCPRCGAPLVEAPGTLSCSEGHSFDVARQGYVNLLPGGARPGTADTPAMVSAREAFLAAGHYDPIASAVIRAINGADPARGCVIDIGAGTGQHLARVLDAFPDGTGIALDISKHALKRAARAHPRAAAIVCDVWAPLPIRTASVAVILDVFAPRNATEFHRVLAPDGVLVVVTPTERHLRELVVALGLLSVDGDKRERLDEKLDGLFSAFDEFEVEWPLSLARAEVAAAVAMGPSARHLDAAELAADLDGMAEPVAVTASVSVRSFRPI